MRALSFFFALMAGLVLAFLAPAMAAGHGQAPEAMSVPVATEVGPDGSDQLAADLLADLEIELAPSLEASA
ncbi:MAG: hypothetical protein ER33_09075 [Cyanobium sp. CACIAM 14]|nr:MAG: hypothetical protein ER33_09075 [Cyanobium sp. CACIAM 14]